MYVDGIFDKADLDSALNALGRGRFFLQVGANDGVTDDPIHNVVKDLGWTGLLFEPMPDVFEHLMTNYAGCEGLTFVNSAITDYEGAIELTRGVAALAGQYPSNAIATVTPEKSFFAINDARLGEKIKVKCSRLLPMLRTYGVKHIDLMVVDVEGADWLVTRQLPLDMFQPEAFLVECHQMSHYEKVAFGEHFRNHGYRVYISENAVDFLALKWSLISQSPFISKASCFIEFHRVEPGLHAKAA